MPPIKVTKPTGSVFSRLFGDRGFQAAPKQMTWAYGMARPYIDKFAAQHVYTDRNKAQRDLAQIMLKAAQEHKRTGDTQFIFRHPVTNKQIRIRINPALAGPKKLARKEAAEPVSERNQLIQAVQRGRANRDTTPMLILADHADENGTPGGNLLREGHAAETQRDEGRFPQISFDPAHEVGPAISKDGLLDINVQRSPGHISGESHRPTLEITHNPTAGGGVYSFTHYITVHSKAHLRKLLADLPANMQRPIVSAVKRQLNRGAVELPDMHEEADKPLKLARVPQQSTGAATAAAASTNHEARIGVVRSILKEAGLSPATVRAALAHDRGTSRPSFATLIKRNAHPELLRYAAAWLGMMSGEKRLAVVHPDESGNELLHVISAPGSPDIIASRLREGGVKKFTTEKTPGGTRAFVLNPSGDLPVEQIATSIPDARHTVARVRVNRVGAGPSASSDARSQYRHVIDQFERGAAGDAATRADSAT